MSEEAQSERGLSGRAVEIAVAILILLLGALVVYDSVLLGWRWGDDGPQSGYFPFYVGAIICVCAIAVMVNAFAGKSSSPPQFVSWVALRRVMQVLGPAAVFVLAIQVLGIYIAGAVYIAVFMYWLGRYSAPLACAIGVGVMTLFFFMFEIWFKVPLYKGLLDPLAFLGY